MNWLKKHKQYIKKDNVDQYIQIAGKIGHIKVIDWLIKHKYMNTDIYSIALDNNNFELIKWLWVNYPLDVNGLIRRLISRSLVNHQWVIL